MSWYKATNERIGGRKCIKHRITKEVCLAGKHGEIWQTSDFTYKALITSTRIAKREFPHLRNVMRAGDEHIVEFDRAKLKYWIKALKVTKNRITMIELANRK